MVLSIQTGSKQFPWEKDGANGKTDENHSITILIHWMTKNKEGNFARFRGNKEGKTKLAICQELAVLMAAENVKGDRAAKNILDKIQSIERAFKIAYDWANNTGQGVDDVESFANALKKRCYFYYELEPTSERPNIYWCCHNYVQILQFYVCEISQIFLSNKPEVRNALDYYLTSHS
jgi:hypothetical protein